MPVFGAHIGLQDTTPAEVVALAQDAEALGYGWISTWDHFYSASVDSVGGGSLEGVSMQAAIAMATSKVRVGTLVYSTSYRYPAVLAKAAATIDLISGGRADLGIGAGFSVIEHEAFGIPLRPVSQRLDAFEEAAQCIRALLHQDVVTFEGTYFSLREARCLPRPVQERLPIWIGGRGERRTLLAAAKFADGWNGAFLSPDEFSHKRAVLHRHCESIGRDPAEIACAANVGIGLSDELLEHHHRSLGDPGQTRGSSAVTGTGQELVDQIGQYLSAGADQVNFTWRAPFDRDALNTIGEAIRAFAPEVT